MLQLFDHDVSTFTTTALNASVRAACRLLFTRRSFGSAGPRTPQNNKTKHDLRSQWPMPPPFSTLLQLAAAQLPLRAGCQWPPVPWAVRLPAAGAGLLLDETIKAAATTTSDHRFFPTKIVATQLESGPLWCRNTQPKHKIHPSTLPSHIICYHAHLANRLS